MKTLLAGPWIGEFGWELFGWQGYVRQFVADFKPERTIIACRTGHEVLYNDFADAYINIDPRGESDCHILWEEYRRVKVNINMNPYIDEYRVTDTLPPNQIGLRGEKLPQKFIPYGKPRIGYAYDLVFHARSTTKVNSGNRNWPLKNWDQLANRFRGKRIASIGSHDGAYHVQGTTDCRGVSLSILADLLSSSKVLIGPSSGPMHFGCLCNIPLVVWSGFNISRQRYERKWNPFDVPVRVIDSGDNAWRKNLEWHPELDVVVKNIEEVVG